MSFFLHLRAQVFLLFFILKSTDINTESRILKKKVIEIVKDDFESEKIPIVDFVNL